MISNERWRLGSEQSTLKDEITTTEENAGDASDFLVKECGLLKSSLHSLQGELEVARKDVSRLRAEKQKEEDARKSLEVKLLKIRYEREKQAAALNETTRVLQAALSDRESLMEQEDRIRTRIEEAERVDKLCQAADGDDEADQVVIDDGNVIGAEFMVVFKSKLKEVKNELRTSNDQLKLLEEENSFLRDELKASRESSETLPLLRSRLARSHSLTQEKEEQCMSLQAQLRKAEQALQEVKAEILSLKDKLIEEHVTAARHASAAEELCRTCDEQALLIETLNERERDVASELKTVKEDLAGAEKQKSDVFEELNKLEEQRVVNEACLQQERAWNKSLRQMLQDEKKKWQQLFINQGKESGGEGDWEEEVYMEASSGECEFYEDASSDVHDSGEMSLARRLLLPGMFSTLVALFYFTLFTQQPEPHPPL